MRYRRLGRSDLTVSEVSLGGHGGSTPEDRAAVLDKAAAHAAAKVRPAP